MMSTSRPAPIGPSFDSDVMPSVNLRVLSGNALIPISSSSVFWTTISTVRPVRKSSNSMASG